MDYLILSANILVAVYAAIAHHKRDDTPVEHPIRMILILSILSCVVQTADLASENFTTQTEWLYGFQIAILLVTGKLIHFLYHLQISSSNDRRKQFKPR